MATTTTTTTNTFTTTATTTTTTTVQWMRPPLAAPAADYGDVKSLACQVTQALLSH